MSNGSFFAPKTIHNGKDFDMTNYLENATNKTFRKSAFNRDRGSDVEFACVHSSS